MVAVAVLGPVGVTGVAVFIRLLKNGIDLYTLSRLLGHESVSITQRYLEGITDEGVIRIARKSGVLENIR